MEDQVLTGHKPVPMKIANKAMKSICKITISKKLGESNGTGFFLKVSNSIKCLLTNYHVLKPNLVNIKIELTIWNEKKIILDINHLSIKYFKKPKDITVIELKNIKDIYNDILFLDFDVNYITKGYNIYKDADIFSIHHPFGEDAVCASGKITEINGYEFDHNMPTEHGSSGCPILLLNSNVNFIQVIGIHKKGDSESGINRGTFIGEIINEINNGSKDLIKNNSIEKIIKENIPQDFDDINPEREGNYIIADFYLGALETSKYIQIINSHELCKRTEFLYFQYGEELNNEEEIKQCIIKINDKKIPFHYLLSITDQSKKGLYKIKYIFKNDLTKANSLFYGCSMLKSIDFSHFNPKNLFFMNFMFYDCKSLISINLSNCSTENVIDMANMFCGCESLISLNLSNFNTENVQNMRCMFSGCSSLKYLNLSNFNTRNVECFENMFQGCSSLTSLNLSSFDTHKVKNMGGMFERCSSLKSLDLSNFDTKNVESMCEMFGECSSLTSLNISNFDTRKVDRVEDMFIKCHSLKTENIIVSDDRILAELNSFSRNFKKIEDECNII